MKKETAYAWTACRGWIFDPLIKSKPATPSDGNRNKSRLKFLFYEAVKSLRYRWLGVRQRPIRTETQKGIALQKTFELLNVAQCLSEKIGAELVIVGIPDHNQVNPEATIKHITPLNFEMQVPLAQHCLRNDIAYLDLLPLLQKDFSETREDYYYFYDRHLNPQGHERVAAHLIQYIQDQSL